MSCIEKEVSIVDMRARMVAVWERAVEGPLSFAAVHRMPGRHGTALVRKIKTDPLAIVSAGYDGRIVESNFRPERNSDGQSSSGRCIVA